LGIVENVVSQIATLSPDVLVLAGNVGYPIVNFDLGLSMFDRFAFDKAALLGNRDLWSKNTGTSSNLLWNSLLPDTLKRHGYSYLEESNLKVGKVGLCGTTGWYDYSGRDNRLKYTVEQYAKLKGLVNLDAQNVEWDWDDQDFAARLQVSFAERIELLERDHLINHVVVVTHFPVFGDAMAHSADDPQWNFGSAYAFNLALGRTIVPRRKLRHVVSGHISIAGKWTITFGTNAFKFHVIGRDGETPYVAVIDI